ncbi:MAG: DUF1761 domain-containing protein [Myxococcales bacterium]|nr:DUF1761 domain-containing protein [Myxococcales bacterium]
MPPIHWPAVLAATLLTFALGGLWYGPLFGERWRRLMQLDAATLEANVPRTFAVAFVMALVAAVNLAAFIGPKASAGFGTAAGAAAGIGWVATSLGTTYAFGRRPLALALIDGGYHALSFTLMGALLGAWH